MTTHTWNSNPAALGYFLPFSSPTLNSTVHAIHCLLQWILDMSLILGPFSASSGSCLQTNIAYSTVN